MKKILFAFLILLTTALLCNTPVITVYADTGPKPSLDIEVIGIEGEYYLDLLQNTAVNSYFSDEIYATINEEFVAYADALRDFRNSNTSSYWILDGNRPMVSGENLGLTDTNSIHFGYMVPTSFQIVIVKENKDIIVTDAVTRMKFNSNMILDLTNNVSLLDGETNIYEFTGNVVEVGVIKDTILGFLYRLFITLAVELLIAIFIFKITQKQAIKIIIITNILTQILLNAVLLTLTNGTLNPIVDFPSIFFSLELFIIGLEMLTYKFLIKGYSAKKLLFYAFVANFVTALITFIA